MSADNPTAESESEPLHLATLLAVLAQLRDRLDAIPALVAEDTADHPLSDVELAEWGARVEVLDAVTADVALMLKDVNPRARVVVLPMHLAFDIGCIECGQESSVIGLYQTHTEAKRAIVDYADPNHRWGREGWTGQHSLEVFPVEFAGGAK